MSILAMNQNVFSSVFVGKKVSKEAKRAIEAEMIVPASAIEMTYDEMEYVDGGIYISNNALVMIFGSLVSLGPAALLNYAVLIKSLFVAAFAGLSAFGVGAVILGFLVGIDALGMTVEISSALSSKLGIEIGLNYKKFFGISIPISLSWEAK